MMSRTTYGACISAILLLALGCAEKMHVEEKVLLEERAAAAAAAGGFSLAEAALTAGIKSTQFRK